MLVIGARAGPFCHAGAGAGAEMVLLARGGCTVAPNHYSNRTAVWVPKSLHSAQVERRRYPTLSHALTCRDRAFYDVLKKRYVIHIGSFLKTRQKSAALGFSTLRRRWEFLRRTGSSGAQSQTWIVATRSETRTSQCTDTGQLSSQRKAST